jgi:ribokinase
MAEVYDVVVVGSANADLVIHVARHPGPGETVLGDDVRHFPGGKGANQAVAASRAGGARTAFLGAWGDDDGAALLRASLETGGVVTDHIEVVDAPTGLAVITVSPDGDNAITVVPGANSRVTLDTDRLELVGQAKAVLAQLEIPLDVVQAAAEKTRGVFLLNAAPSRPLSTALLAHVDVLIVNEHEAADLAGRSGTPEDLANTLLGTVAAVVVTLGSQGSLVAERGQAAVRVASLPVTPVDTTGAGDTFCGTLAARLAAGDALVEAARQASAAGALAVTKAGAQPSIPTLAEVTQAARGLA